MLHGTWLHRPPLTRSAKVYEGQSRAASAAYLNGAMAHFTRVVFPRASVGFVVASDEPAWSLGLPQVRARARARARARVRAEGEGEGKGGGRG